MCCFVAPLQESAQPEGPWQGRTHVLLPWGCPTGKLPTGKPPHSAAASSRRAASTLNVNSTSGPGQEVPT